MASHRRLADTLSNEIKKAEKRGRAAATDPTTTPLRPRTRSQGLAPSPRRDDETPAEAEVFSDGSTSTNESFNTPTNQSFADEEETPSMPGTPPPVTTAPPVINIIPVPPITTAALLSPPPPLLRPPSLIPLRPSLPQASCPRDEEQVLLAVLPSTARWLLTPSSRLWSPTTAPPLEARIEPFGS
jgi:hypothetical protein